VKTASIGAIIIGLSFGHGSTINRSANALRRSSARKDAVFTIPSLYLKARWNFSRVFGLNFVRFRAQGWDASWAYRSGEKRTFPVQHWKSVLPAWTGCSDPAPRSACDATF